MPDLPVGDPRFGTAVPCRCTLDKRRARLAKRLAGMDAMTEAERALRFDKLVDVYSAHGTDVIGTVRSYCEQGRGMLTLHGVYGIGKSALLQCAVNAASERGVAAVYTTAATMLDYLRRTYGDGAEMSFDDAWDTLTTVPVLAIDEIDKVAVGERRSNWALERLDNLIDTRWRHMHEWLTLFAVNRAVDELPGAIASRLHDGRGRVIRVQAQDMRPWLRAREAQDG